MLKPTLLALCAAMALAFAATAQANVYPLPAGDTLIGALETVHGQGDERPVEIARRRGLGHAELTLINPTLDVWLPGNKDEIVLPLEFVLPNAPHKGIVLNIPEMRLYYYRPNRDTGAMEVITYPVGIGREGVGTPHQLTRVASKARDPVWIPPDSIRAEHAAMGDILPARVGPGPDNPMGTHALRLALPMYAIHGTNKPWGVGMRVSHGCIRLYNEHIAELFEIVPVGTPVNIVNQPYKVGVRAGRIYLEAHPSLDEDQEHFNDNMTSVVKALVAMTEEGGYQVDWELARQIIQQARGIPVEIGRIKTPTTLATATGHAAPAPAAVLPARAPAAADAAVNLKLDPRLSQDSR